MAKFSLRRFDTQARVGVVFGVIATVAFLGQAAVVLCLDNIITGNQNMDWSEFTMTWGPMRKAAVYAMTAITMAASLSAIGFGFNSAGQRRNDKPGLSWAAFFLGAVTFTLAAVMFVIFRLRGEEVMKISAALLDHAIQLFA